MTGFTNLRYEPLLCRVGRPQLLEFDTKTPPFVFSARTGQKQVTRTINNFKMTPNESQKDAPHLRGTLGQPLAHVFCAHPNTKQTP